MTGSGRVVGVITSLRSSVAATIHLARLLWASAPALATAALVLSVLSAAAGTGAIISSSYLISSLQSALAPSSPPQTYDASWFWLTVTVVLLIVAPTAGAFRGVITAQVTSAAVANANITLARVALSPSDIRLLDSPGFSGEANALARAVQDRSFAEGADSAWGVFATRLAGIGAFSIVCSWHWWVAVPVTAAFVAFSIVFSRWIEESFDEVLQSAADELRVPRYSRDMLFGAEHAQEIRIFGWVPWLTTRLRTDWYAVMSRLWPKRRATMRGLYVYGAVLALAFGAALAILGRDVFLGAVGAGGVVMLLQALITLDCFGQLGDQQSAATRASVIAARLADLRTNYGQMSIIGAEQELSGSTGMSLQPGRPLAVSIESVTFTYPTQETAALRNVSLEIAAGQSVAIVGVNGAGKSTLVKLLVGLYRPETGKVRVGGLDPSVGDELRAAVIFQDFCRYPLSLQENVWLPIDRDIPSERESLSRCLTKANAGIMMEQLPDGQLTVLSPEFEGGLDLSGGQWQRIALARALSAIERGAGLLILDEPTSALDVRSEVELFNTVLGQGVGVTTILVSHRLSGARLADRILVLDPTLGVVEDGAHDELMSAGGAYAEMFSLQASRFRSDGTV